MSNNISVRVFFINNKNQTLLIRRIESERREPNKLILPGGRVEVQENIYNAIIREIKEELGLNCKEKEFEFIGKTTKRSYEVLEINYLLYRQFSNFSEIDLVPTTSKEIRSFHFLQPEFVLPEDYAFNELEEMTKYYLKACNLLHIKID